MPQGSRCVRGVVLRARVVLGCFKTSRALPRCGRRGTPPPQKMCLGPANLAVLLTHCARMILREIGKLDATRRQILSPKCTKFDFR